jgi:hypothetical protein
LRDSYAATIMPLPRYRIPILTVAGLIEIAALQERPRRASGVPFRRLQYGYNIS